MAWKTAPERSSTADSTWPPLLDEVIEDLLPDILESRIDPGRVFDRTIRLDEVPDGYRQRRARSSGSCRSTRW